MPEEFYDQDVHLTAIDASSIYNTLITELENGVGEPLYPGDERRIYGEALVAVFVALYNTMDDIGRQTLLRYARGEVLDAIGERLDVHRLEGDKSAAIVRFSLSAPVGFDIKIPQYTKVTPDGEVYFATDRFAVLKAGDIYVDILVSALEAGTGCNGYAPGTISTLVDMIPYIESVVNLTETSGGDDGEPYTTDGDDRFRERIRLAPAKRSTAGPELSYIYWAMTADSSIADVKAVSETETVAKELTVYDGHAFLGGSTLLPDTLMIYVDGESSEDYTVDYSDDLLTITLSGTLSDAQKMYVTITPTLEGCVKIVPLLKGGGMPDSEILEKVMETVNASDVRPLTDRIFVVAPEVIPYDIEIIYYTTPETEAEVVANVEGADGAIARFNEWQSDALGRDINPDQLRKLILSPSWAEHLTGAIRLDVVKPDHKTIEDTQVAKFSGNLKVSHKNILGVV